MTKTAERVRLFELVPYKASEQIIHLVPKDDEPSLNLNPAIGRRAALCGLLPPDGWVSMDYPSTGPAPKECPDCISRMPADALLYT